MRFEPRFDDDCPVCAGFECQGGGNTRCRKRDKHSSHLAGILDTYGSLRFIISHQNSLKYHVRCDEILIIVPGIVVHEPIAWNDISAVTGRIKWYVGEWIKQRRFLNEPHAQQAVKMYQLRCLEQDQQSLDISMIAET